MGRPGNIGRKWYHPKKSPIDLPRITAPFTTGIIDPPWIYTAKVSGVLRHTPPFLLRRGDNTCAAPPYPTLSVEEIKKLPIGDVIGGYLFLWTTYPMRDVARECLEGWGFEYKSEFVWGKVDSNNRPAHGVGFWLRGAHEIILIGAKKGMPCIRASQPTLLLAPKTRKHSEKPNDIHRLIERHYPEPYVELFARKRRHGWTCIGNEIDGRDIRDVLKQYLPTAQASPNSDADNVVRLDFAKR